MNKKYIEFKKKWLQWVLEFIQTDLNSLSRSRMRGLTAEAYYFGSNALSDSFESMLWYYPFDKLTEIQIVYFNETFLNQLRKERALNSTWHESLEDAEQIISEKLQELPGIQADLKKFFEEIQATLEKFKSPRPPSIPKKQWYPTVFLPDTENRIDCFPNGFFTMRIVPKSYSSRDWAVLNFAKLINDFHDSAIIKCAGCGRYFLNPSNREKFYCNSVCASRSVAHRRYEELRKDPKKYEAHLKKYRKLSSQRYKRLRQLQYGPKVKIQKRRKNRKEG